MRRKLNLLLTFHSFWSEPNNFSQFGWIPIHLATTLITNSNKIAASPSFLVCVCVCVCVCACRCVCRSVVSDSSTPWTVAHQAPLSMQLSRQDYWNGLPFPSPEDLPNPRIEPRSPSFQVDSLSSKPQGKPPFPTRQMYLSTHFAQALF